jgi:hypothetical protein
MPVWHLQRLTRRNPTDVSERIWQGRPDAVRVTAAVGPLREDAGHLHVDTDLVGVLLEAERGRGDALHPGFRVDHEHDWKIQRFGHPRGAGSVPVVQTHDPLDDRDVTRTPGVVPAHAVDPFHPHVERP